MTTQYLCRHANGDYFLASPELANVLDGETIRGPVNIPYAMPIRTGTGTTLDLPTSENKYRWASVDCWRVAYWPDGGGSQAYVKVDGIGWVVDVDDELPHSVWTVLLKVLGAPLVSDPYPEHQGEYA